MLVDACCRVTKVRQFQKLALMSAGDGQLQQRLKQLLKLSKEKWDSACEHAKTAVQVSNVVKVFPPRWTPAYSSNSRVAYGGSTSRLPESETAALKQPVFHSQRSSSTSSVTSSIIRTCVHEDGWSLVHPYAAHKCCT